MANKKDRHTVWMEPDVWDMVENHYRKDNCSTKNEYIQKAVQFYSGYLDVKGAGEYLPRVLSDVLESKLSALGSRIGRLLFKLAVEQDMNANTPPSGRTVKNTPAMSTPTARRSAKNYWQN